MKAARREEGEGERKRVQRLRGQGNSKKVRKKRSARFVGKKRGRVESCDSLPAEAKLYRLHGTSKGSEKKNAVGKGVERWTDRTIALATKYTEQRGCTPEGKKKTSSDTAKEPLRHAS